MLGMFGLMRNHEPFRLGLLGRNRGGSRQRPSATVFSAFINLNPKNSDVRAFEKILAPSFIPSEWLQYF